MACATFHLTEDNRILSGADYGLGLTLKDGAGAVINLTGATFASQIRRTQSASDILATFSVSISDAVHGKVTLSLPAAVTGLLPSTAPNSFWKYDLKFTKDGTVLRILEGDVEVDASVTR